MRKSGSMSRFAFIFAPILYFHAILNNTQTLPNQNVIEEQFKCRNFTNIYSNQIQINKPHRTQYEFCVRNKMILCMTFCTTSSSALYDSCDIFIEHRVKHALLCDNKKSQMFMHD